MVRIEIDDEIAHELIKQGVISAEQIKEVIVKDNFFDGNETHKALVKASLKAYKELKEYEFKTRHKIN